MELTLSNEKLFELWKGLEDKAETVEEPTENEMVMEEKPTEPQPITEPETAAQPKQEIPNEIINLLPEKFRSQNIVEAISKLVESYKELEAKFTKTSQELAEATRLLQTITSMPPQTQSQQPVTKQETDEFDVNIEIDPKEVYTDLPNAIKKAISQAAKQFAQRLNPQTLTSQVASAVMAQMALMQLRSEDPKTFELVKEDLLQVLKEKPYLDNVQGLRVAYEEAKERYKKRQEELRRQLIDEEMIKGLKDALLRELASKMPVSREIAGVPANTAGGGAVEIPKTQEPKKGPSEILKELILSMRPNAPLLTESF